MAALISPAPFQPGFRLIDGDQLNKAIASDVVNSQDGMVANGTTRITGTQIQAELNRFTTVASGGIALMPPALPGTQVLVMNAGANALTLDGFASTDTIDGGASATLSVATRGAWFTCTTAGAWISAALGAAVS